MVIVPGSDQLAPSEEHSVHDALAQRVRVLHHCQSGRGSRYIIGCVLRAMLHFSHQCSVTQPLFTLPETVPAPFL